MGAIGRILLIIVVLAVLVVGGSFFLLPTSASRTQTFTIDRPPASVFARLASTPPGTVIAEGVTQTAITSAVNNVVVAEVAFADGSTGTATYTIASEGQGSSVAVKVEQALGQNPLDRLQGLTGGSVGPVVEAAAATATTDLNALPQASFSGLAYEVVQVDARPFLFVQSQVPNDAAAIKEAVAQSMVLVQPILMRYRLQASGPPMAVETEWVDGPNGHYAFQAGVPYTGQAPRVLVGVTNGQTPAGTAIRVNYTGAEENVIPTYDQMEALIESARLTRGRSFEIYYDDPAQVGGSVNRDIFYLVTGDTSALARVAPSAGAVAPAGAGATSAAPAAAPAPAAPVATDAPAATTPPAAATPEPAPAAEPTP